ncbi:MAG: hypothetical protein WC551_08165 [Patescibacteria group bacterium]
MERSTAERQDTRVARIIRAALTLQSKLAPKIPEEKRRQGEGRIGKFVVDDPSGKDHTVMYFQVKDGLLRELVNPPAEVRNQVIFVGVPWRGYTGVDLLLDCARHKNLLRKAYAEHWFVVTPELIQAIASYDSEEMIQMAEDMLELVGRYMGFRKTPAG